MQAVIFIGIQASGKTTFYRQRFFESHIRINLDMLRTRRRQSILLHACIHAKQPFVVDNTNPTVLERARYIVPARAARFRIIGYYFDADVDECIARNEARAVSQVVPVRGIMGTRKRLQLPSLTEGFDELFRVRADGGGSFSTEEWLKP